MTDAAATATSRVVVTTDRHIRKRPVIIEEKVRDVIRIYDGPANNAIPTVEAALKSYDGQNVCISIVAATTFKDLVQKLGTTGTLEERMRSRLAEMEKEVLRLDNKEKRSDDGLSLEEYDVRDAFCGAIVEFKSLLGISS